MTHVTGREASGPAPGGLPVGLLSVGARQGGVTMPALFLDAVAGSGRVKVGRAWQYLRGPVLSGSNPTRWSCVYGSKNRIDF